MNNASKQNIVPVSSQSSAIVDTDKSTTQTTKAEVIMALNALDSIYKDNIRSYADALHRCTHEIDDTKTQLEHLYKEIEPNKIVIDERQKEIDFEMRSLERYTQEWEQINVIISVLHKELKELNHSKKERESVLNKRNESLQKLEKEIQKTEIKLLKLELEVQHITLSIEVTEREISALELRMKKLENSKRYIESTYLHHISPSASNNSVKQIS